MTESVPAAAVRRLDPGAAVCAAVTSLAALLVGAVGIGRSFGYDEAVTYTAFVNGGSLRRALTEQVVFNNHQTFSAVQAVLWRLGFVGETAQRLGPVVCGAATVGLLTWWLARHVGRLAGVAGGALLLLNPIYLAEFRTLRGYSLSTLAALVAVLAIHRSWTDRRRRWLVVGAVAMTVAATTHSYAVLPVLLAALVTVVVGRLRREHVVAWVAAAVASILIQLPLLDDARRTSAARGRRYLPGFLRFTVEQYLGARRAAVVIVGALVVIGLVVVARRSRRHAWAVAAALAALLGVVLVLWQLVRPFDLYSRFFVAMTPYLAAAAGIGAAAIPRRVGVVPVVVAIAMLVPNARRTLDVDPPIRDAAAVVDAVRGEGAEVCGTDPLALEVYTAPVRAVDGVSLDGPTGFGDCDVLVAVLGVPAVARQVVDARFEVTVPVRRGLTIHTSADLAPVVEAALAGPPGDGS